MAIRRLLKRLTFIIKYLGFVRILGVEITILLGELSARNVELLNQVVTMLTPKRKSKLEVSGPVSFAKFSMQLMQPTVFSVTLRKQACRVASLCR